MPKWLVELSGDNCDLENLHLLFTTPEFLVIKEVNSYFLISNQFDSIKNASEVQKVAQQKILPVILVAADFFQLNFGQIQLGCVVLEGENGNRQRHVSLRGEITMRSEIRATLRVDGSKSEPQVSQPARWAALTQEDLKVEKVFRLWKTKPIDWVNLYRIFEVIKSDVEGCIYREGWISKNQANRFKHTANSVQILGDEARHGDEPNEPPAKPMNLNEADQLIRSLVQAWLDNKLK